MLLSERPHGIGGIGDELRSEAAGSAGCEALRYAERSRAPLPFDDVAPPARQQQRQQIQRRGASHRVEIIIWLSSANYRGWKLRAQL